MGDPFPDANYGELPLLCNLARGHTVLDHPTNAEGQGASISGGDTHVQTVSSLPLAQQGRVSHKTVSV